MQSNLCSLVSSEAVPPGAFGTRWARLAGSVGLEPEEPLAVALSGGADSVLLLALLAASEAAPPLLAIHVEHGLRGAESEADARFCSRICDELGVTLVRRRAALDPGLPGLEARAREARYQELLAAAHERGFRTLATGHHADDALETVLMRLLRGTELAGLSGLRLERGPSGPPAPSPSPERDVRIVHPLLPLRREEVRHLLLSRGLAWRQDSSNTDRRFMRNRVRHGLLPWITAHASDAGVESLRRFAASIESFEHACAERTAELTWTELRHVHAVRGPGQAHLGGRLDRARLEGLPTALLRRVLSRLLVEGIGRRPRGATLASLVRAIEQGGRFEAEIATGWRLELGPSELLLHPPEQLLAHSKGDACGQGKLPFDPPSGEKGIPLQVPGTALLPDGRRLIARLVDVETTGPVDVPPRCVRLDAGDLQLPLVVRAPRPGDRFHGLGAPGSRPVGRFLRDAGVAATDRRRVPLVFSGDELIWVAGIRPAESRRMTPDSARCFELELVAS